MKRIHILLFTIALFLMACGNGASTVNDDLGKAAEEASKKIGGMQFLSLEAKGVSDLFEEIKELKVKIVIGTIRGQDVSNEKDKIAKVKKQFNEKTLSKISLQDVQLGGKENDYIAEFENQFVRETIEALGIRSKAPASGLKIIYDD